jgi:hypothetical protein
VTAVTRFPSSTPLFFGRGVIDALPGGTPNGPRPGDDNRESHGPDLNAIVVQKSAVDVDATMPAVSPSVIQKSKLHRFRFSSAV